MFVCEECGCVENTALCGWITRNNKRRYICSACNPEIGKWHGMFPRRKPEVGEVFINRPPV
jgi:hypothetical protein